MAEFGVIAPQGLRNVELLTKIVAHEQERLPEFARQILQLIVDQLHDTIVRVRKVELHLTRWHRQSQVSQLLATVPSVGIMGCERDRRNYRRPIAVPIRP
jgi:transposase